MRFEKVILRAFAVTLSQHSFCWLKLGTNKETLGQAET